jgi:hypothetical protein
MTAARASMRFSGPEINVANGESIRFTHTLTTESSG